MLGLLRPEGDPGWDGRATVHRDADGEVDGYLRWRAEWGGGRDHPLTVDELVAATDAAYADLWRFALSVDLITNVKAEDAAVDEALPWLVPDARAVQQTERYDNLWLRVLDVPAALTGRDYLSARAGSCWRSSTRPGTRRAGSRSTPPPEGATCRPDHRVGRPDPARGRARQRLPGRSPARHAGRGRPGRRAHPGRGRAPPTGCSAPTARPGAPCTSDRIT